MRRPVLSSEPTVGPPREFLFDAFASYATDPDRELVRDVEAFIESLVQNPLVAPAYRRTLELCVDGSDFSLPRRVRNPAGGSPADEVFDLVRAHMEKCRTYVLFVGPRSVDHPWINRELAWWLDKRGNEDVLIVVTHGRDPKNERKETFPKAVLDEGLDQRPWIDLRGFRPRRGEAAVSLRDYEEERLRLAAGLMGSEVRASDLIAGWKRAAARQRRRRRFLQGIGVTSALAGAAVLGWAVVQWHASSREALASGLALVSRQSGGTDANRRLDALAYAASSLAEEPGPLGSATLITAAQSLPKHLRSIIYDPGGKAADIVRFLAGGRLVLAAGYSGVLDIAAVDSGRVVGRIPIAGRARSVAVHPHRPLVAVATQRGLDLVAYTPERADAAPRITGRAAPGVRVQAVVFEPGGETLIAGDFDGVLARYRIADATASSWQPMRSIRMTDSIGAKVAISGLALDPVARGLAVSDIVGQIYCLDLDNWTQRAQPLKHSTEIFGMVSSPDGRLAAAADASGGILLFRPADCTAAGIIAPPAEQDTVGRGFDGRLRSEPRSERAFTGIAFSPDGSLLGVASHDRTVRIYTVDRHALTHVLIHQAMARTVDFSPSNSLVATGAGDGRVEIWDTGATVESWRIAGVGAFAVDPKGRWIATWADDDSLRLLDPVSGRILAQDRPSDEEVRGGAQELISTLDGGYLAARASASTRVLVWDLTSLGRSLSLPPSRPLQHPNEAGHVAIVAALVPGSGAASLVTGERHQGNAVRIWDATGPLQRHTVLMSTEVVEIAAGRGVVVAADRGGQVRVVSGDSGAQIGELQLPGVPAAVAVAPDGHHFFVGYVGKEQRGGCLCGLGMEEERGISSWISSLLHRPVVGKNVCEPAAGALHCHAILPEISPTRALFSPRSDRIVIAVSGREIDDGSLYLLREWDRWQPSLLTSGGRVRALDFTEDGTLLAAGGQSRSAEIFDSERGEKVAEIPLANPLLGLRFLPGPERRILTLDGFEVGFLRLWDWRTHSLIAAACARWPELYTPVRNPTLPEPKSRQELCGR